MVCAVIAQMAGERLFTSVSPQMNGQVAQARGTEVAHIAGEGFLQMLKQ